MGCINKYTTSNTEVSLNVLLKSHQCSRALLMTRKIDPQLLILFSFLLGNIMHNCLTPISLLLQVDV
jgi:hypothetical protein